MWKELLLSLKNVLCVVRLYFTKIQIGNPAKEYHVQVDTGSDMMWVHCNGCEGCPKETRIEVRLLTFICNFFIRGN